MKRLLKWLVILLILGVILGVGGSQIAKYFEKRNQPEFLTAEVKRGDIRQEVRTTGTVEPVLKVHIGSFVSGPILELHVDFNDHVEKGQLLAKVDPRIYRAAVLRDEAALATAEAEIDRVKASLQQAINDEHRAQQLQEYNSDYIAQAEMDQFKFARMSLEAQLRVAIQSVKQAEARLKDSQASLAYTDITAPEDGVIIDRKIDPGQTLAAQFQTPELFVLAPHMDERMWVHASVVEMEIGKVMQAQKEDRTVQFTVDAYPDELFQGRIHQVRQNSSSDQNVVTYPVIVETPNPDGKLLPGMTATISFETVNKKNTILVPSPAIRFLPDVKYVREADKKILEGEEDEEEEEQTTTQPSVADLVAKNRERRKRHVWIEAGDSKLRAVEVVIGITDGKYYELIEGDLSEGSQLVKGIKKKK